MSYEISEIEGVGPAYAEKFATVGIKTTEDLLEKCCDAKGRATAAEATGFSESQVLKFTNMADLMRISGVAGQYAELMKASGVDTIKELRTRNAANLAESMTKVNDEKKLSKGSVTESTVQKWIDQAKEMEPMITH